MMHGLVAVRCQTINGEACEAEDGPFTLVNCTLFGSTSLQCIDTDPDLLTRQ
jgi:hypothetical protein